MKKVDFWGIFFLFLFSIAAVPGFSEDTGKFDFYYQRVDGIVRLEPEKAPSNWWEKTKLFATKGLNFVKKYFEQGFTRNIFPGEGEKLWYSKKDPTIAYKVTRVKVTSEKQLLEAMGATGGDESKLTDGQRSLLSIYRNAKNQMVKDLSNKAIFPRIAVHLTDMSNISDSKKYPHARSDFWPQSMGFSITLPSSWWNYPNAETDALSTFVHETAHCTNLTFPEFIKPYGPDGVHYADEITKPRQAFQEAWSEYHELLVNPEEAKGWERLTKTLDIEDPKIAGKYTTYKVEDPRISANQLFAAEAIGAWMMYRLSRELPDGRNKVDKAFYKGNFPWRDIRGYLKGFAKLYPQDAKKLAQILDESTARKLTAAEMIKVLGDAPGVKEYLSTRQTGSGSTTSASGTAKINADAGVQTLQIQYERAYKAYTEAARQANTTLLQKARAKLDEVKAKLKRLGR